MDFLTLARSGKNEWWRILLFLITLAAFVAIATLSVDNIEIETDYELITDIFIEGIAFSIVLIGVFLAIKLIHQRSFLSLNGSFKASEFFEGVAIWGALVLAGSLINQQEQWRYFLDNRMNASLAIFLPSVIICIAIQSYTEEVVFRGYLFQTFSLGIKNLNLLIVVCSSIFGILHGADGLAAIVGTAIFGGMSCYIVLKRNGLSFVTGMHLIHNFFFVYLFSGVDMVANDDFLKFDLTECGILLGQFLLLFFYVNNKKISK